MIQKRIFAAVLSVVLLIGIIPFSVSAETVTGTTSSGLEYSIDTELGEVTITGCKNLQSSTIPKNIMGYPVTVIGERAFYCSAMRSFSLPDTVKTIEKEAFSGCARLESVNITKGVTYIGEKAFNGCSSLGEIELPSGLTSIEPKTFCNCTYLTEVIIPNGVISIGESAFQGCSGIMRMTLPVTLTSIGNYMITGCDWLESVTFNGTRAQWQGISIGEKNSAWKDKLVILGDAKYTDFEYTLDTDKGEAVLTAYTGSAESYTVPKEIDGIPVTAIGEKAFYRNETLHSVTVPETVQTIGDLAFASCENLRSISLPEGLTAIGNGAFRNSIKLLGTVIPETVTSIGGDAFYGCSSIENLHIPASVEAIGKSTDELGMFTNCDSMIAVTVDENNENYKGVDNCIIDKRTKTLIAALPDCRLPDDGSIEIIDDYVFSYAYDLIEITIPDSVTHIGNAAFKECINLEKVSLPKDLKHIGDYAFYATAVSELSFSDKLEYIGDSAFSRCNNITEIFLPDTLTYETVVIGNSAFAYCKNLISVRLCERVTRIEYTFYGCEKLESISLGKFIYKVGEMTFYGCNSLKSIYIRSIKSECASCSITVNGNETYLNAKRYYLGNGDANGDGTVNAVDSLLLRMRISSCITNSDLDAERADLNGDSLLTAVDSLLLKKMLAGL